MPWLVLPDGSATSIPHGETFQLPDGVRCHSSCGEWLLLSRHDGSCFLMNHFTKATMPLPSLSSYSYYQEPVEVNNMVFELALTWKEKMDTGEMPVVLSLVVCSTRLVAAIFAVGDPCTIAPCTIALCRPGAASWSVSAHKRCMLLSHMVFFQGKLYALEVVSREVLIAIDIVDEHDSDEPRVSRIGRLIEGGYLPCLTDSCYLYYLVESHGTLLMIRRKLSYKIQHGIHGILVARSSEFEVFEADFEQRLWTKVRTLGNSHQLFVGQRYSRAVHVSPYDVSRDCIFFLDDCPSWVVKQTTESCGVYDMKDEKVYSPLPMVSWKSKEVPATWIFSQCETDKLQTDGEGNLGRML